MKKLLTTLFFAISFIALHAQFTGLTGTGNVSQGCTGNTTFTAYSVVCAGTTSTGAFQNVSGLGTSGQVLQSNGSGSLPTWNTLSGTTQWTTSGSNIYFNSGNVGIGSSSPSHALHVVGSIKMVDGNQGANKVLTSDANGVGSWQTGGGGGSQWTTNGSDIYYNTGKVGIGISSPTATSHVVSTGTTSATFALKIDNNSTIFPTLYHVRNDGWIGAGDNVNRNLSIGFEAGFPTPDGNNLRNTFLGTKACSTFTAGYNNTIVGSIAMWQANNCQSNTGVGTEVLYSTTTGSYNTVMGNNSGFSLTTGSNNTFLGYESGIVLTTTSNNTAVGYLSLDESTSGQNDAFGAEVLGENTTGTYNLGVGQNALGLNVTGNNNTAVGINAGFNCKGNGASNVYVGYQAGYNNYSGSNGGSRNVYVGESAGQENTGSGNVFIGYRVAQSSFFDGYSNILQIHNADVNNPLIIGDFSNNRLGINLSSVLPSEKLTVAGRIRSTNSDIAVESSSRGFILKDTQATPHYWRITISNAGVLTTTDVGTSLPSE